MNNSIFNSFRLTVRERQLQVYGIHLYQEGKESLEHRWRSDDKVCLYSGSKTFTSVGVGICQDEGRLRLTDKALDFFPEWKKSASPGTENITLRDLLHMSSGKDTFWGGTEEEREDYTRDWLELFFSHPMSYRPGEKFIYSNACTYTLGRVIEKVSGQNLRDYLIPRLFQPLGIFNPQWQICPQGHTLGASGLFLRTEEFSRIGRLLLQDGVFGDKQVVSSEYVQALHSDWVENGDFAPGNIESSSGYGYQVWRCSIPGIYRADGMYGQFSIVIPEKRAVVTLTSHQERNANDIITAVFQDILPNL